MHLYEQSVKYMHAHAHTHKRTHVCPQRRCLCRESKYEVKEEQ